MAEDGGGLDQESLEKNTIGRITAHHIRVVYTGGMKRMADPIRKDDQRYTYGEYREWADDERWELIDGVAWNMSPAPSRRHQEIVGAVFSAFYNGSAGGPCRVYVSPFDVLLPDFAAMKDDEVTTVVQPDVLVFCDTKVLTDAGATGPPTLLVEVLSPSTAAKDMRIKLELYERHGVREYWIVDPGNRFVEVFVLGEDRKYPSEPKLSVYDRRNPLSLSPSISELAGVTINLAELFENG
jgi:Uma2 family endonuclease